MTLGTRSRILAIDTANARSSLALWWEGRVQFAASSKARDNLGWLDATLCAALEEHGLAAGDLDAIAVTIGPGAMTGLRIGVGYAQSLALGLGLPMLGINTLSTIAWAASQRHAAQGGSVAVALDARMAELYAATLPLSLQQPEEFQDRVLTPEQALAEDPAPFYAGPGWEHYAHLLPADAELISDCQPDAVGVAHLAVGRNPVAATELRVHYLRQQVARVPERLQR